MTTPDDRTVEVELVFEIVTDEQSFPDCFFCGPCRCDDECECTPGPCWACGHSVAQVATPCPIHHSERALVPEKITGWLVLLLLGLCFLIWLSFQVHRTIGVP